MTVTAKHHVKWAEDDLTKAQSKLYKAKRLSQYAGGVLVLSTLASVYFAYDAFSTHSEKNKLEIFDFAWRQCVEERAYAYVQSSKYYSSGESVNVDVGDFDEIENCAKETQQQAKKDMAGAWKNMFIGFIPSIGLSLAFMAAGTNLNRRGDMVYDAEKALHNAEIALKLEGAGYDEPAMLRIVAGTDYEDNQNLDGPDLSAE